MDQNASYYIIDAVQYITYSGGSTDLYKNLNDGVKTQIFHL